MNIETLLNVKSSGEVTTLSPRRQMADIGSIRKGLEDISTGIELTVTYRDDLRARHNEISLTDITRGVIMESNYKSVWLHEANWRCILVGEFSPLGAYHMHGIIQASPRLIGRIKRRLARDCGRCEFKMIKFTESYINYVLKDTDESKQYTNGPRKIYKDEVIDIPF